jgi:hypothetical protein
MFSSPANILILLLVTILVTVILAYAFSELIL